jgi:hypothetical protein
MCVYELQPVSWGPHSSISGGEYPNQKFAGYIAAGSKIMSHKQLSMLSGKTVSITGTIELYQGKQINIIRADQIKVLHSQTGR